MNKITVRQGQTFQLPVEIDDASAETVTLRVWNETETIINQPATFVDGKATIDAGIVTAATGLYSYAITVTYSDGAIDILPNVTECTECDYPEFEVCEGLPAEEVTDND